MTNLEESLIVEEFKQIHEHSREHERAIGALTIVIITSSVTILSVVGLFYFRIFSQNQNALSPNALNIFFSYLFLMPLLIVFPLMSAIRGHRESLYKMGYYLKIFYEEKYGGAAWALGLEKYRKYKKGESQDSVPYFAWTIAVISFTFYLTTLRQINNIPSYHYFAVLILILPMLIFQHWKHKKIKGDSIEKAWRDAKKDMIKLAD